MGGTSFEMHAFVQLATRTWLAANGQLEQWMQQFISILSAAFPTGAYKNWAVCGPLFAHAKAAMEQRPEGELPLTEWATLLYRGAWYAVQRGNAADSERLALKSMRVRRGVLSEKDEDTLSSMGMMEGSKTKLGAHHPDTLTSMVNLASTYINQGRWGEAEKLDVQVMETSKTKLGADHPDTLSSMNNLASTYSNQGRWDEAEKLDVQVMETRKTKLGADHPDTLTSMNNLAYTLKSQPRHQEALALMERCFQLRELVLGEEYPDTQSSLNMLSNWRAESE
ncbi:unnamed protein product [Alternaria alternata]